jgi:hypothetical protein
VTRTNQKKTQKGVTEEGAGLTVSNGEKRGDNGAPAGRPNQGKVEAMASYRGGDRGGARGDDTCGARSVAGPCVSIARRCDVGAVEQGSRELTGGAAVI